MNKEHTEEEITQMKMKAALEASEQLPTDTFAAVPDEDIVTLEVSGQFGRVLNRVLEYLYQCEDEATVIKSANLVANAFCLSSEANSVRTIFSAISIDKEATCNFNSEILLFNI